MSARILTCTDEEYFADPCVVPSLSQSIACTLVSESPLHAWARHPRLGKPKDAAEERSKVLDKGKLFHKLLLGAGQEVEIVVADDWRTKAAQAQRDTAILHGRLPVLSRIFEETAEAVLKIRANILSYGIVLSTDSEVKLEWTETATDGTQVLCRGMLDNVHFPIGSIYDVKSIRSADPRQCERHMIDYGYHIQDAAYRSGLNKLRPELQGRAELTFLFCELDFPYVVQPAVADGAMRELGDSQWRRAVDLWARCLRTNQWPAYSDNVVRLAPPAWALSQELSNASV